MKKQVLFTMIFLNAIYILMVVIFILNVFSYVEIKGESLKKIIHFGVVFALIIIVSINFFVFKSKKWNILVGITSICYFLVMSSILSKYDILRYVFSSSSWNTQTILYESKTQSNKRIEFQMQDVGALGYNKRTVEVVYFSPWFMITKQIDPSKILQRDWKKVHKNVNELNFVY
jgi:hypothetical protein